MCPSLMMAHRQGEALPAGSWQGYMPTMAYEPASTSRTVKCLAATATQVGNQRVWRSVWAEGAWWGWSMGWVAGCQEAKGYAFGVLQAALRG